MTGTAGADAHIDQIVEAFENGTIRPAEFGHEQHLLVAWRYLQDHNVPEALSRLTDTLRKLTKKLGVAGKYHETVTWFYLLQIAGRRGGEGSSHWPAFKAANPDLFAWKPGLIQKYYSEALLSSETARRMFVFPDRMP